MKHVLTAATLASLALLSKGALCHISLDMGTTHKSRYGGEHATIKEGPCGLTGGTRGSNVYTYEAGETIMIEAVEYIRHPGYFRIAFDEDGDDDFVDPATVKPINRPCMTLADGTPNPLDKCGADDFFNDPSVLMDNLDPHVPEGAEILQPLTYKWEVKLPDVACERCTLQVIQVMTDVPGIHAPYNPTGEGEAIAPDDIYYQCIDLVLTPRAGGSPTPADGGTGPSGGGGSKDDSKDDSGDDGGCAISPVGRSSSPMAPLLLAGLGLLAARMRRSPRARS